MWNPVDCDIHPTPTCLWVSTWSHSDSDAWGPSSSLNKPPLCACIDIRLLVIHLGNSRPEHKSNSCDCQKRSGHNIPCLGLEALLLTVGIPCKSCTNQYLLAPVGSGRPHAAELPLSRTQDDPGRWREVSCWLVHSPVFVQWPGVDQAEGRNWGLRAGLPGLSGTQCWSQEDTHSQEAGLQPTCSDVECGHPR